MKFPRPILAFLTLLAVAAALAACGGDDAPTDEEYFRTMDATDKEVDTKFDNINCDETTNAQQCADGFGEGVSFAETEHEGITPSDDAKNEHGELVAALIELRESIEGAEFQEDDPGDVFFESGAFDTTRVDSAFCAIQDLADAKSIEADVGCDAGGEEGPDPATLEPVETTDVLMEGFAFDPPHIQVTAGDTVTWEQGADPEPHNAAADDESFAIDVLEDEGLTGDVTFDEAGVFPYFCEVHQEMRGQVTVVE